MNSDNLSNPESQCDPRLIPLLNDAIASLPRIYREAVILKYLQGKSHAEVAAAQTIHENAARQRLFRAIEKLRTKLNSKALITAGVGTVEATLVETSAQAAPAEVISTLQSALFSAQAPSNVAALATQTLRSMYMWNAKIVVAACSSVVLVLMLGVSLHSVMAGDPTSGSVSVAPASQPTTSPSVLPTPISALAAKLQQAVTVQVAARAQIVEGGQHLNVTATFILAPADRLRADLKIEGGPGGGMRIIGITDGQHAVAWVNGQRNERGAMQPTATSLGFLTRLGVAGSIENAREVPAGQQLPPPDVDKDLPITDVKEVNAPIDGVSKPAIAYMIGGPDFSQPGKVLLWLDPATGLPVRREITTTSNGQERVVTETYTDWKLGEVIDPAMFDLDKAPATQP